uniref:Uncharacterized protein n=1 Tax=Spongospora subterranea TaxID=70186 RepID=A0A0H5RF15_9EUKA|eukprot:CRZ12301.1 hypothetical protein [Spongospora subterranea]
MFGDRLQTGRRIFQERGKVFGLVKSTTVLDEIVLVPETIPGGKKVSTKGEALERLLSWEQVVMGVESACNQETTALTKIYNEQHSGRLSKPIDPIPEAVRAHIEQEKRLAGEKLELFHEIYRRLVIRYENVKEVVVKAAFDDIQERTGSQGQPRVDHFQNVLNQEQIRLQRQRQFGQRLSYQGITISFDSIF